VAPKLQGPLSKLRDRGVCCMFILMISTQLHGPGFSQPHGCNSLLYFASPRAICLAVNVLWHCRQWDYITRVHQGSHHALAGTSR
jgi:hypothetical protein